MVFLYVSVAVDDAQHDVCVRVHFDFLFASTKGLSHSKRDSLASLHSLFTCLSFSPHQLTRNVKVAAQHEQLKWLIFSCIHK